MNIISWVLFGILIGSIANLIDPKPIKGGIMGTAILGAAGALSGGFLATLLFKTTLMEFDIVSFLIAIGGSLILLIVGGKVLKKEQLF